MDLVDEQDRLWPFTQFVEQRLEALLEVTTVLGAGQQRTEVQGVDHALRQQVRHLAIDDSLGQAFRNGRLADTGLTDQQRVILAATRKDLRHTLDFQLTTDQRINAPLTGLFVEVAGIGIQRIARR
ncbi:hypothetical protein D3C78_1297470 [compost metagenome]